MQNQGQELSLRLSLEEAVSLLEMAMMSSAEMTTEQSMVLLKLSEFCRNTSIGDAGAVHV